MKLRTMSAALGLLATFFMLGGQALAQCPAGSACTEYLGEGKKGSFFRLLVPDAWDGDLFIINHGFDLNELNITGHHVCQHLNPNMPKVPCTTMTRVRSSADYHLRWAAEHDADNPDRWIALANAYALKPDPGAAYKAVAKARELDPAIDIVRDDAGLFRRQE